MIKKHLLLLFLCCFGGLISTSNCMAANLKVGVVNLAKIMKDSQQIRQSAAQLRRKFSAERNQVIALQKSLEKLSEKFRRDSAVMSDKEKADAQKQMAKKTQEFNQAREKYSSRLFIAQQAIVSKFVAQAKIIVNKIAGKNHLDIIFAKNALLYVTDRLDITAQVENALNRNVYEQTSNNSADKNDTSSTDAKKSSAKNS